MATASRCSSSGQPATSQAESAAAALQPLPPAVDGDVQLWDLNSGLSVVRFQVGQCAFLFSKTVTVVS